MNAHSFCRELLRRAIGDLREVEPDFELSSLSVTKSSLGGYEVQGPNRFYLCANSACCVWSAKAEAVISIFDSRMHIS